MVAEKRAKSIRKGRRIKMITNEEILVQIGEFVFTEIKEVEKITYGTKETGTQNSFEAITNEGQVFVVEIRQK